MTSDITDLGSALATYIGAGDDPRARFAEVHDAIEKNRTLQALLRSVEAERLLNGLDGPRITAQMRDVATASGTEGGTNRDNLFYALTDALVEQGVRLTSPAAAPAADDATSPTEDALGDEVVDHAA